MRQGVVTILTCALLLVSNGVNADTPAPPVTLIQDFPFLVGANNVVVNGLLYNVQFKDGLASIVFADFANLPFTTALEATAAAIALRDQVFNGLVPVASLGMEFYDERPAFTRGCGVPGIVGCQLITPYTEGYPIDWVTGPGWDFNGMAFINLDGSLTDGVSLLVGGNPIFADDDLLLGDGTYERTWAVWSPVVTAVPEPEIYAMLGMGLGLMGFMARRRKKQAA